MGWDVPSFVEIKMDAEIGAYQDDFGTSPDVLPAAKPVTVPTGECGSEARPS